MEKNKNMTAFDWFISKLPIRYKNAIMNNCKEEIQQTKEIDKQNIIDAWTAGREYGCIFNDSETGEQYYNETYGKQ